MSVHSIDHGISSVCCMAIGALDVGTTYTVHQKRITMLLSAPWTRSLVCSHCATTGRSFDAARLVARDIPMQVVLPQWALRVWNVRIDHEEAVSRLGWIIVGLSCEGVRWSTRSLWRSMKVSYAEDPRIVVGTLRRVVNLLPRLTALLP